MPTADPKPSVREEIDKERNIAVSRLTVSVDSIGCERPNFIGREAIDNLAALALRLAEQVEALTKEIEGLRRLKQSVDEALNSGDGVYRP